MTSGTATNLKILGTVVVTLGIYTWVANAIPQLESEVPEEVTFSAEVTPEELVTAGEDLFDGAGGCTACHGTGTRAPNLLTDHEGMGTIGERCDEQVEDLTCKEYLYESMVEPNAHLVEGFPPSMPPQDRILSNNQIWALIAYLQSVGGSVTVTAEDIQGTGDESGGGAESGTSSAGGSGENGGTGGEIDAVAVMQQNACFSCHTLGDRGTELGPSFDGLGERRSAEHIRESIVDPMADAPEGYEDLMGTMPPNFEELLTEEELQAMVDFLAAQE